MHTTTHRELTRLVARAYGLLGHRRALALALDDGLYPVELPATGVAGDPDLLRAIAALYLAASFEAAGVIPAAEDLTRLARSGAFTSDLGDASALLQAFWRDRNDRASEPERLAFFADVFGTPERNERTGRAVNLEFEERLLDLCEALFRYGQSRAPADLARVRRTCARTVENLMRAAGGLTALMAEDILTSLRSALALLGHPRVWSALRARNLWDAVMRVDELMQRSREEPQLHVERGRAGMMVLGWLAGIAEPDRALPDDSTIEAAATWMEATLDLGEAQERQRASYAVREDPASQWTSVAR